MARRFEKHAREGMRCRHVEKVRGKPSRLIGIPIRCDLVLVATPPELVCPSWPWVGYRRRGEVLLDEAGVPHLVAGHLEVMDVGREALRLLFDPREEGAPCFFSLLGGHAVEAD